MKHAHRVVVTGLGAVTPLGNDVQTFWSQLLAGVSGAAAITCFDASKFRTRFACEVKGFDPLDHIERRDARRMDRFSQLSVVAARQGIEDAFGKDFTGVNKNDIGVIWAAGIGGLATMEQEIGSFYSNNLTPRFNPFFIPKMIIDITAGWISIEHGLRGPNFGVVSACASSAHALISASAFIRSGQAPVVITGGGEASVSISSVGGFNATKALSEQNDDPTTASRPFDKDRNGFVLGEGSACVVLESYAHAKARGAKIYAELIGCGMSGDAYHLTAPHPEGLGVSLAMTRAIEDAGIQLSDIGYVNAHATSTQLGDLVEIQALEKLFGAHSEKLYINGTKSMTGHLLGAAGALEALTCVKTLESGYVPPTINHFTLDPELNPSLNYCFSPPKESLPLNVALSNSFGFGGHNATLIFRTCEESGNS